MRRHQKTSHYGEILAVLLLFIGLFYFLALVSYNPKDLPSWVFFSSEVRGESNSSNFFGPVGAVIAGYSYFLLGAASFLVAVLMFGLGGMRFIFPRISLLRKLPWAILFVVSGACIAHLQTLFLQDWPDAFKILGPGGWLGYWLGERCVQAVSGRAGALLILVLIYFTSLILLTGLRPLAVLRAIIQGLIHLFSTWQTYRRNRMTEIQRLADDEKLKEKERLKLEREIRKKQGGKSPAASANGAGKNGKNGKDGKTLIDEEFEDDLLPLDEVPAVFPEPKIIDNSLPSASALNRSSIADIARHRNGNPLSTLALQGSVCENYILPDLDQLDTADLAGLEGPDPAELNAVRDTLIETLDHFGIKVRPGDITRGPTITRYEVYPAQGVRVDKITALERDLARATRAERINILAPVPGKDTVGIEIANTKKVKVTLRELLSGDEWANTKAVIPVALGKDVYGRTIIADLAKMPHCLVAGTTGSGKSVCINSMIASMLYRFTPDELKLIMIDPKVVEMQIYNRLPHLAIPVVTEPKKVIMALKWVIREMETRYKIFAAAAVRNIAAFNARPKPKSQAELDAEAEAKNPTDPSAASVSSEPTDPLDETETPLEEEPAPPPIKVHRDDDLIIPDFMPLIVVIVDELADLMQTAPADVEGCIARITQMARAAGIHMIVATQTPRVDVVTGVIKANIPCRIAFQVASKIDSRVILDEMGAERLIGQGDMLYMPPGSSRLIRAQGVLVTDEEISRLVDFVAGQAEATYDPVMQEKLQSGEDGEEENAISDEEEALLDRCIDVIRQEKRASTSMLRRRLRLGYNKAARMMDILCERRLVGPTNGSKDREILFNLDSED